MGPIHKPSGRNPKRPVIDDRSSVRYSVSGLMRCPHCRVTMQPLLRTKKVRRPNVNGRPHPFDVTWRCRTQAEIGACQESGYGNLEHVETHITNWLERQSPGPPNDFQERIERASARSVEITPERPKKDRLSDLERQEDNLALAVSVGAISLETADVDRKRSCRNGKRFRVDRPREPPRLKPITRMTALPSIRES